MVEGACLENRCAGDRTGGSNPSLTASTPAFAGVSRFVRDSAAPRRICLSPCTPRGRGKGFPRLATRAPFYLRHQLSCGLLCIYSKEYLFVAQVSCLLGASPRSERRRSVFFQGSCTAGMLWNADLRRRSPAFFRTCAIGRSRLTGYRSHSVAFSRAKA